MPNDVNFSVSLRHKYIALIKSADTESRRISLQPALFLIPGEGLAQPFAQGV